MGTFFVYILKSAVCLSLFYLFYRLLLSRETFHRFNRIAVLGLLLMSLLIPFCEVQVMEQTEVHQTVLSLEQLLLLADLIEETPVMAAQEEKIVWVQVVLLIYLVGVLFFICRNLYSLGRLGLLLRTGKREKLDHNITLIVHDRSNLAPFSWMRYIVIARKDLEENGREIIIHELAHIRKRHSIDLLIADSCIFFQWFNPAAWLLKQELQNIHEYEADEAVIKEGVDAKQYQLLIIKKAVGTRLYSMANSFNHSKLKKRITMMLKEKSNPWARLKYLYVLPLAAIAVSAFARPEISTELKEISEIKVNDLTAIVTTNEVENQVVESEIDSKPVVDADVITTEPQENKKRGKISDNNESLKVEVKYDETTGKTEANIEDTETDGVKVIGVGSMKEMDGRGLVLLNNGQEIKIRSAAKPQNTITINGVQSDDKKPLVILDGKEITHATLSALRSDRIKLINVLKDKAAVDTYGERGANGVIIVELFTEEEIADNKKQRPKKNALEMAQSQIPPTALFLLDGNEIADVNTVDPEKISTIKIYKPSGDNDIESIALFEKYGDKAKDGIISITLKKPGETKETILYVRGSNKKDSDTMKVQGQVRDNTGKPIVGAAIVISGTNVGAISDFDGKFILETNETDQLVVSYIGMKKAVVKSESELIVTLEVD